MKNKYRTVESKERDNLKGLLALIIAGMLIAAFINRNAVARVGRIAEILNIYGALFLIFSCIVCFVSIFVTIIKRNGAVSTLLFIAGFVTMLYFTSKWCYKLVIDARNEAVEEQYKVTGLVKGEFYGAHPLHVRYTVECFNEETGEKETFRIDEAHYEDLKDAMDQMAIEETEIDNITISVKYLPGTKALMELNRME